MTVSRPLTAREKWLLLAAGVFVVLYLFYNWVFAPQWEEYQRVQEEIKTKSVKLDTMKVVTVNLKKLEQENKRKAESINFPKNFQLVNEGTVLLRLDGLAAERGLEMLFYQPVPVTPEEPLPAQVVEVKIAGPYNKVVDFFEVLDNEPYRTKAQIFYMKSIYSEMQDPNNQALQDYQADILNDYVVVHFNLKVYDMPESSPAEKNYKYGPYPQKMDIPPPKPKFRTQAGSDTGTAAQTDSAAPKPIVIETTNGEPVPPVYIIVYRDKPAAVNSPATKPPAAKPPTTNPPATKPPTTNPPATKPPTTDPPAAKPPVYKPPVYKPPAYNTPQANPLP